MNLLQRIEYWGDRHHPKWADIPRVALGIFLCFKGIEFLENMSLIISRISSSLTAPSNNIWLMVLGHYVVFAHLLGGLLLAMGFLTRFACVIQIPILLGAIFLVNTSGEQYTPFSEILLAILVLIGLIYFLIAGNGPWSVDRLTEKEQR
jgi:uncharacterized membrane protein YphA (DoxX/SURF4 family)